MSGTLAHRLLRLSAFIFAGGILALSVSPAPASELPGIMLEALDSYRAEGAYGWAFEQCTRSGGEELVESYNPAKSEGLRWSLVSKDGKPPSPREAEVYARSKALRSSAWNAPRLEKQIDRASGVLKDDDGRKVVCNFRLTPADPDDVAAEHLLVICTADVATKTIERVEIGNREPFSPSFGVRIDRSKTVLLYSLPSADRPSLLLRANLEVEGRMFWVKSINQTMEIVWGNFAYAGVKR